ncbi:hypothetical protein Acr_02g0011950 [Actinidia rufa]|uniref:Uncharacterized protein n=1 Tax=Actinidia rufa TaxID=165716 RepID=A0A7J0E999_9ERIC|nr:hypothetical protein Acr_02g0011950 [Actinidia rufa]
MFGKSFSTSLFLTFVPFTAFNPSTLILGFPYPPSTNGPSLNSLAHLLLANEEDWPPSPSNLLKQKGLKDVFRVVNHVLCDLFLCTSHVSEIDETCARFMHAIASNLPVNVSHLMFKLILEAASNNSSHAFLPFGLLVTDFLAQHLIMPKPHETRLPAGKLISRMTLRMSNAHLGVSPPPPPRSPHVVDIDPSDNEVPPPAATDFPSTSTTPPPTTFAAASTAASDFRISDAIVALFAYMNVIHTDLVEGIGQVHERVDLIVERQEHDIKAIRDTLSALSHRHTEFITEENDFINSIRRR